MLFLEAPSWMLELVVDIKGYTWFMGDCIYQCLFCQVCRNGPQLAEVTCYHERNANLISMFDFINGVTTGQFDTMAVAYDSYQ
ncbi:hypothetical protein RHMOL_Rhmol01G0015800 [Rhododendron molle]|uniref:Uncharacterized protein n=1 Tax=Rhododendron molle TaxID=49168 RepID=A0ACC0PZW6_RHOML|nr:hypothetical protein RHMOL_Rhmol01G0015800 [Rhododendron molle]